LAEKQIDYSDLRSGEQVTLRLRDGESVIVGTVTDNPTPGGNVRVTLKNNKNSVVLTPETNFRIFADRGPTVGDVLGNLSIGTVFSYRNKFGKTLTWVKSGADRATKVDDTRPAYSLSLSVGFPAAEEAGDRIAVTY
jgi:hypothetical protein